MPKSLSFDDIAKNLLVYLKGQVPSLANKNSRDEILRQVQSITFTLRATIVQLEGAAFSDNRAVGVDAEKYEQEIVALKEEKEKLSKSLADESTKLYDLEQQFNQLQQVLQKTYQEKAEVEAELRKATENFDSQSNQQSVSRRSDIGSAELEAALEEASETIRQLKQSLQDKEIELTKTKNSLLDAVSSGQTTAQALKMQMESLTELKTANTELKEQLAQLKANPGVVAAASQHADSQPAPTQPTPEVDVTEYINKIKFLEDSLAKSLENQNASKAANDENKDKLEKENQELHSRISDLESTIKSLINNRNSGRTDDKFTFTSDECIFLFDTLAVTARRLETSQANKDVYAKARKSISILEKSKAITKIPTIGQVLNTDYHKVTKAFKSDFLPDETILFEETPGFLSGNTLVQKAIVWIAKSRFVCSECGKVCRPHEFFCSQCGLELTAPDGTSKRELLAYPLSLEVNMPLLDELMRQGNVSASIQLLNLMAKEHPNHPEVLKRQSILMRVDEGLSKH